jgi:hypothetical protein
LLLDDDNFLAAFLTASFPFSINDFFFGFSITVVGSSFFSSVFSDLTFNVFFFGFGSVFS